MDYRRWFVIVAVLAALGWAGTVAMQRKGDDDKIRAIKKSYQNPVDDELKPNLGPEPPSDMVVRQIPNQKIWFVGKYEDGGGVEIPFKPGTAPKKTDETQTIGENPGYVGPEQCQECHQEKYQSFLATAHYKTSRPVNSETIDGCFQPGCNALLTSDPGMAFEMIRRDDDYLQRVHFYDWSFEVPMEIIMGSSKLAQTYLYWHKDGLYQHNVTHISDGDKWINSPGYIDGDAAYARPIPQRCMECHMTYFDFRGNKNRYTPDSLILGVTCERCHGPGDQHVGYHRKNPGVREPTGITNPAKLDRQVQMDICGQCHGGSRALKGDALSFQPGDRLDDHYAPPDDEQNAKNSVHTSNQLTRLSESVCFQQSQMTCINCHDPHHNERGDQKLFSQRCMACHTSESDCGLYPKEGVNFADNCVDCHMPQRPTDSLQLKSIEGDVFPPLRDHFIRVDRTSTEDFLDRTTGQD